MWSKLIAASCGISAVFADCDNLPLNEQNLVTRCNSVCDMSLGECLQGCEGDSACISTCNRDHAGCSSSCPCASECPNGCTGCSNPICNTVLVLHTNGQSGPFKSSPVKLDYLGHEYRQFNFEMNDVEVLSSCMAELNGEHYIFGGSGTNTLQMAKIDGCGTTRMPDLPFTFSQGTCGTYQWTTDTKRVVLCFDYIQTINYKMTCRTFDGENFEEIAGAAYFHNWIRFGNYKGNPIAIGDGYQGHSKVEILNIDTTDGSHYWSETTRWPFRLSYHAYSIISEADRVITFGGYCHLTYPKILDEVTQFKDDEWTLLGRLNHPRYGHASISNGLETLTLGGMPEVTSRPNIATEDWQMWQNSGNFTIVDTRHGLANGMYFKWPEVLNVPYDFCSGNK